MTSSTPSLTAHWAPKGPANADRKVRGLPVPSRLRTGVREARAAERANEERKREDQPPEREAPAVPTDRPGTRGMENVKSGGESKAGEKEDEDVASSPKKGRR